MTNEKESSTQVKQSQVEKKNELSTTEYYDDDSIVNRPRSQKNKFSVLAARLNLSSPQRKGFVRQWVIDKEQHIFLGRDWKPVKGEDGQPMRNVMNRKTKDPEFGTYMEIPEIYFQENLRADDEIRKEVLERKISNKDLVDKDGKPLNAANFYTPDAFTNKIERNNI